MRSRLPLLRGLGPARRKLAIIGRVVHQVVNQIVPLEVAAIQARTSLVIFKNVDVGHEAQSTVFGLIFTKSGRIYQLIKAIDLWLLLVPNMEVVNGVLMSLEKFWLGAAKGVDGH